MRKNLAALLLAVWTLAAGPAAAQVPGLELTPNANPAPAADAPPATADSDSAPDTAGEKAAHWVRKSLDVTSDALRGAKEGLKEATGLSDDQLFGIGVGVLAGVAAADILGTGGLGSLAVVGIGGMIGNWAVTRDAPNP